MVKCLTHERGVLRRIVRFHQFLSPSVHFVSILIVKDSKFLNNLCTSPLDNCQSSNFIIWTSCCSFNPRTPTAMRSKSRSTASDKRPMSHRVTSASTGIWPPHTSVLPNFQQRSVTPDPWPPMANNERHDRVTQRPKTVSRKVWD